MKNAGLTDGQSEQFPCQNPGRFLSKYVNFVFAVFCQKKSGALRKNSPFLRFSGFFHV